MDNFNIENIDDFVEREKHYKEKIEQLENDLQKERDTYEIFDKNSEIIINLKNDISSKEKQIQEITAQNNKQKEELELVSHEIDLKLKKLSDSTQIVNIKKRENQSQSNEDIKMKEKQINNVNSIIDILQNENEKLKNKLDYLIHNNGASVEKYKTIELDKKILSLNKDIKKKKLIIQEDNKCASIKNQILKKINLIQKDIYTENEISYKIKKKLGTTGNKYMQIKQDYENKIKSHKFSKSNKKVYLKKENPNHISFSQDELSAILYSVNNDKNAFYNVLKKLNLNEDDINNKSLEGNNNIKYVENQIEIFQNKQKVNIEKSNKLLEQINEIELNNSNKNKKINLLKNELDNLLDEQNNITSRENKDNNEKDKNIINNKINTNFRRIKIDANKNREDNS